MVLAILVLTLEKSARLPRNKEGSSRHRGEYLRSPLALYRPAKAVEARDPGAAVGGATVQTAAGNANSNGAHIHRFRLNRDFKMQQEHIKEKKSFRDVKGTRHRTHAVATLSLAIHYHPTQGCSQGRVSPHAAAVRRAKFSVGFTFGPTGGWSGSAKTRLPLSSVRSRQVPRKNPRRPYGSCSHSPSAARLL